MLRSIPFHPNKNLIRVPQGSILGPLLFTMYINDLPDYLGHCDVTLYADDTVLFISYKSLHNIKSYLNSDLEKLTNWLKLNHLTLSISKSKFMIIGSNQRLNKVDSISFKGTVSQTAHVQVINQKWSDVFKFVICETKWRQQAEDNPHSHGGRRNNSGRKQFFLNSGSGRKKEREKSRRRIRLEINIYKSWLQAKLEATYSSTRNSEFAMNLLLLENRRR